MTKIKNCDLSSTSLSNKTAERRIPCVESIPSIYNTNNISVCFLIIYFVSAWFSALAFCDISAI